MAKSTIATILTSVKRRFDYDITDSDFDNLVYDILNDVTRNIKQLLFDNGFTQDITSNASFKTVENQAYVDLLKARIVGNVATFTGIANDKIKVTIDGVDYDDISIATATTITLVATAINNAVGSTVATVSDDGYLIITSPTSGTSSSVTIADGTTTAQTVVGDLFSTAAERTQSYVDIDELLYLSERTNDLPIDIIPYTKLIEMYPDPTADTSDTPDVAARFNNRIYFGPTPNDNILVYIDYIKFLTVLTSSSNMPFDNKFDPLAVAMVIEELGLWLDPKNTVSNALYKKRVLELKDELIIKSVKNVGMNRQSESRRYETPYFNPRKVV